MLRVAIRLIGLGVAGGTLGSLLTNRLVARQVWTVPSFDPTVLLAGIATIVILGIEDSASTGPVGTCVVIEFGPRVGDNWGSSLRQRFVQPQMVE